MNTALQAAHDLVANRDTAEHDHPSMLQNKYISASRLVYSTAEELAREILADVQESREDEPDWAEYGDARAEQNLRHIGYQEPSLRIAIPGTDWTLDGHADGLSFANTTEGGIPVMFGGAAGTDLKTPWLATIYENKAPLHEPSERRQDLYYRQGLLYLAMLNEMQAQDTTRLVLQPAPWRPDDDPMPCPMTFEPGQVTLCIQPITAARITRSFPVDAALCQKHLADYVKKAKYVIKAVEAGDPELAVQKWDHVKSTGLKEFLPFDWDMDNVTAEDEGIFAGLLVERAIAKEKADDAALVVEAINQRLKALMFATASTSLEVRGAKVSLIRQKGGITHSVRRPSWQLRVTGEVQPAKASEETEGEAEAPIEA